MQTYCDFGTNIHASNSKLGPFDAAMHFDQIGIDSVVISIKILI